MESSLVPRYRRLTFVESSLVAHYANPSTSKIFSRFKGPKTHHFFSLFSLFHFSTINFARVVPPYYVLRSRRLTLQVSWLRYTRLRRLTLVESYLVPRYRRLTFVESYLVPGYRRHGGRRSIAGIKERFKGNAARAIGKRNFNYFEMTWNFIEILLAKF